MPKIERIKSGTPGVYWREVSKLVGNGTEKCYYIMYRQGGRDSKLIEEPIGRESEGITERKASEERLLRMRGKSQTNAERREQVSQEELAKKLEREKKITFGQLWELYRDSHGGNRSIKEDSNLQKLRIEPVFGNMPAIEITTAHITEFRKELERSNLSPQTIKHALGHIKKIIRYAITQGYNLKEPVFSMPKVDNKKTENMTGEQMIAYLHALDNEPDQNTAGFYALALATGMRKGALFGLKWEHIDFEKGMILLSSESAKNKKNTYIPMNARARYTLNRLTRSSEYVFPGVTGGKRVTAPKMGRRLRTLAGLSKDFRPIHGLRHVFASWLASSGKVDIFALQKLMTHESIQMTIRYSHLMDEAIKNASNVMDSLLPDIGDSPEKQ